MPKSCWSKAKFFIWHSARDTKRNKCHFGLAFCSIFTVVFSILVINSVISQGPLIFVSIGQANSGQVDAIFSPIQEDYSPTNENFYGGNFFFNYTQVVELYNEGPEYNLAPRKQFCQINYGLLGGQ